MEDVQCICANNCKKMPRTSKEDLFKVSVINHFMYWNIQSC